MTIEEPMDFGGNQILAQDLISDDLICKIKGLNPDLGRPMDEFGRGDPYYSRYAAYRDEIENAELIVIDANALNRSSVMNLDLSGDFSGIEQFPSDYYQLAGDTLAIAFDPYEFGIDSPDCSIEGLGEDIGGYCEFSSTELSDLSNGIY